MTPSMICRPLTTIRLALLGVLALVAGAALAAPAALAASQTVQVTDNAYVPPAVAVLPDETVTWNFPLGAGVDRHNVHFEDEQFRSPAFPTLAPWTTPPRTFAAAGVYRYYCDEHGGPGGVGMAGLVYVNATGTVPGVAPSAAFAATPEVATVGQVVGFDASVSSDSDATIARYEWDLDGNGTYETDRGGQSSAITIYQTSGTRIVRLRVTDSQGLTAVTTRAVTVTLAPTASFIVSPGVAQIDQVVSFDASLSSDPDGTISRYEWDLDGNGSFETDTSGVATTSRTYASPGTFEISLRVTDNNGIKAQATRTLQIAAPVTPPAPPPPPAVTPPPPPAAVTPPPPAPGCSALKGSARTACEQKLCAALKGTKRATCISKSCKYVTGAKKARCIQTSCRYVPRSKRASCNRSSCRYLTGTKRRVCNRKYARRPR